MQSPPRPSPPSIDRSACPLCGGPNRCAMEVARETGRPAETCWCTGVDFSAGLIARVPVEAQGQACICETCARRAVAA